MVIVHPPGSGSPLPRPAPPRPSLPTPETARDLPLRGGGRPKPRPSAAPAVTVRPHSDGELTGPQRHGVLRIVTDTCVRLWRRVHMDLVRYAGCVCRPSC
ncbi:putative leader peptide [Streptomyces sp. NPDC048415]|uniref:putative leader peptide n=1 Tax=Streptomyces sp. NPDC048415 TaxID=3154822 RepID=UPI003416CD48